MQLTKTDIAQENIVNPSSPAGQRETTYDATVGEIIYKGVLHQKAKYTLPSRGIVWVVSAEEFKIPNTVTGMATLRTTWTHNGVLALNVGVIDPGWQGPIATALVNFSDKPFTFRKGDQFFRLIFNRHQSVVAPANIQDRTLYVADIVKRSKSFSKEFLNMDSLRKEVAEEIFKLPKWAFYVGFFALVIAIFSIFIPIAWSVWTESAQLKVHFEQLDKDLQDLKKENDELKKAATKENADFRSVIRQDYVSKDQLAAELARHSR